MGEEVEVASVDLGGKGTWLGGLDLEVSLVSSFSLSLLSAFLPADLKAHSYSSRVQVGFVKAATDDPESFQADAISQHLITVSSSSTSLPPPLPFLSHHRHSLPPRPLSPELTSSFASSQLYSGLPFSIHEPIVFDYKGRNLKAVVKSLSVVDLSGKAGPPATFGILTAQTDVSIVKDGNSKIKIKASGKK